MIVRQLNDWRNPLASIYIAPFRTMITRELPLRPQPHWTWRQLRIGGGAHNPRAISVITLNASPTSASVVSPWPTWKRMTVRPSTTVCVR